MIRRPPRSTLDRSSAASDVYKRQHQEVGHRGGRPVVGQVEDDREPGPTVRAGDEGMPLSLIHISEPTRPY